MINDSLADNPDLLNQLYAFLEIESPLNPLLASFFSKVMGLLITRKPDVFVTFLKERGEKTLIPQVLNTKCDNFAPRWPETKRTTDPPTYTGGMWWRSVGAGGWWWWKGKP